MSDFESLEATRADVAAELTRVESLDDTPAASVEELELNPPELGYYQAGLESLRAATEGDQP
jgi:hypothetical protein